MKLILVFLFYLICIPQHEPEKIHWNENKKLSWEDFRGKPQRSAVFVASSNTGIGFSYSYSLSNDEVEVKYSVESFFYPEQSWYLPEKVSPYILKHEQTHFDISELHARILRKRLDGKNFSTKIKTNRTSKNEVSQEPKPKELNDIYSLKDIGETFDIPQDSIGSFIDFLKSKGISHDLLMPENEIQLIEFLTEQRKLFLKGE